MGWASGFEAGTRMGKSWLDTYREAERRREIEAAQKDVVRESYTPAQGAELRGLAEQVDAQGRPIYNIESTGPGTTGYNINRISYDPNMGLGPAPAGRPDLQFDAEKAIASGVGPSMGLAQQEQRYSRNMPGSLQAGDAEGYAIQRGLMQDALARDPSLGRTPEYGGGVTPEKSMAPAGSLYLDKRYEGGLSKQQQDAALLDRYADIIAKDDPVRAQQMKVAAAQMQMTQEKHGLEMAGLQRTEKEAQKMDAFQAEAVKLAETARAEGRQVSFADMSNLASQKGLNTAQQRKVVADLVGISTDEQTAFDLDINKSIRGKNFEQLIDLHKNDPRFDDKTYFESKVDPKTGAVVLNLINQNDKSIISTKKFTDTDMATAYLQREAKNPGQQAEWLLGMRAKEAQIRESEGKATYYEGGGARRPGVLSSGSADAASAKKAESFIQLSNSLEKSIIGIDKQLGDLRGSSPEVVSQRDALIAKRNALSDKQMKAMDSAEALLSGGEGGGLQREGAATTKYEADKWYPGPDGKTEFKYSGKGDIKDEANWEKRPISAAPAAAPAAAAPAAAAKKVSTDERNLTPEQIKTQLTDIDKRLAADDVLIKKAKENPSSMGSKWSGFAGGLLKGEAFPLTDPQRAALESRKKELLGKQAK